jgi:hypothetical protein
MDVSRVVESGRVGADPDLRAPAAKDDSTTRDPAHRRPRDSCPWCHRSSRRACCLFAASGGIRAFAAAYGIKAGLAVLMLLIKGRLNLRSLGEALVAVDPIRLGVVVGLMSALTRATRCLLARLRGTDDKANAFLSALLGGCASALDDPARRSGLGIYLLCRALYSVAHTGLRLGAIPRLPGALVALFAFANTGILYAFAYEPHLLDRSCVSGSETSVVAHSTTNVVSTRPTPRLPLRLPVDDGSDAPQPPQAPVDSPRPAARPPATSKRGSGWRHCASTSAKRLLVGRPY